MPDMNLSTMRYTRPNVNISWGPLIRPENIQNHYDTEYIQSGYIVKEETSVSDDGLVLTRKIAWATPPEILTKYKSDTIIQEYLATVRQYNQENGITPSVTPSQFQTAQLLLENDICIDPFRRISSLDEF